MTYLCPKGHQSTEPDYCSECGLRIGAPPAASASPAASAPAPSPAAAGGDCPVCGAPRAPGRALLRGLPLRFRRQEAGGRGRRQRPRPGARGERSRDRRRTRASASARARPPSAPMQRPSAGAGPPPSPPPPATSLDAIANPWAIVTAEKSLMGPEAASLTFPEGEPQRSYPLDLDENLVGRRSARTNVHPEIPVGDPSVSSRHLKICRRKDGSLYLVDVGSSNGTKLNGVAVEPGVETSLKAGDQIVIGAWTKIAIEAR